MVGDDILKFDENNYLVVRFYFYRLLEIVGLLSTITTRMMLASLKKILIGTLKLCSEEMNSFANRLDFYIITPSYKYLSLTVY